MATENRLSRKSSGSGRVVGAAVIGALVPLAATACGGVMTTRSHPKEGLAAAEQATASQSYRADLTAAVSIGAVAQVVPQLRALNANYVAHVSVENAQRSMSDTSGAEAGKPNSFIEIQYDGTVYSSTDGGVTFFSSNGPSGSQGLNFVMGYLDIATNVTDAGPSAVDGVRVERYQANLDARQLIANMKTAMNSAHSSLIAQLADTMTLTRGHLDVTVDRAGRLVSVTGVIDLSMNLGSFAPSASASSFTFHQTFDEHFHDYGSEIIVRRPTNITSTPTPT